MRTSNRVFVSIAVLALCATASLAASSPPASPGSSAVAHSVPAAPSAVPAALATAAGNAGFEKLATLVGAWEATLPDGSRASLRYELVSSGTALLERIGGGSAHSGMGGEMVTVYHPDGATLLMTHYCSANNQPRMRAEPAAGEVTSLHFAFVDASNLASPAAGHMHDLVVTFGDRDHFSQQWTFRADGKDMPGHVLSWTRKK